MELEQLRHIERWTLYLVPVAGLIGLCFGLRAGAGALLGAAVTAANFAGIRRIAERVQGVPPNRQLRILLLIIPKFAALVAVVALIVRYLPIDRIAFLCGFSTFLVAIGYEWIRWAAAGDAGPTPSDEAPEA